MWKLESGPQIPPQESSQCAHTLVWQPAAPTLSMKLKSSQVKSMQLGEGTLYSEQFYAQNILLCLGTINIFKIILPSPSDYSKKKTIQIYSSAVFVLESLL